jgi:hypothetical protein
MPAAFCFVEFDRYWAKGCAGQTFCCGEAWDIFGAKRLDGVALDFRTCYWGPVFVL